MRTEGGTRRQWSFLHRPRHRKTGYRVGGRRYIDNRRLLSVDGTRTCEKSTNGNGLSGRSGPYNKDGDDHYYPPTLSIDGLHPQ